jgi:ubiquinol-cytochrome c reductase cytochrome b subunit
MTRDTLSPSPETRSARPSERSALPSRVAGAGWQQAMPLMWTSLLGVISLACLFVLTTTGVVLLFFYDRSSETVPYSGTYPLLQGVPVSKAYASTMHISFEVPLGLLVRQAHHWAALLLPASLMLQLLSTFFSGGFRRPRQWSWVLLAGTFLVVLGLGWSGYALPDDMLAGTGLRIVEGVMLGIPLIGTRVAFVFFGGEFPGSALEHMYWLHVAVFPAMLLVLLTARLLLALRRRPAHRSGPGRTEDNVVGLPLATVAARSSGLFLVTCGVLSLLGGLVTINPVWVYGPASAGQASAGSQPDWYTDFLDGSLRLMPPGWEIGIAGHTVSLALLIPQAAVGVFFGLVVMWPFLESRVTRDRAEHHVLDRAREHPVRTAFGVSGLVFFLTLWLAGATDLVTTHFGVAFEHQVVALRTVAILGPLVTFPVTRSVCLALLEREREQLVQGVETGRIMRASDGGYSELHATMAASRAAVLSRRRES